MNYNFVAIEGNIGAGKTTLSKMLAQKFGANLVLEEFADNPFLPGFYDNPEKFALPVEMFFLAERFKQLSKGPHSADLFAPFTVSDYFIYKSLIFAEQNLSELEFDLYKRIFEIMVGQLPKPDILIYLYLSPEKLKKNILKRGRAYEKNISFDYLNKIQQGYLNFFAGDKPFPILIVETESLDFVQNTADFEFLTQLLSKNYPNGRNFITI
jgi:deoxyguanosine kinase